MLQLNETHDPGLVSCVEAANDPASDFPIQSLPLGVFRRGTETPRVGAAIGDHIIDIIMCLRVGLLDGLAAAAGAACETPALNGLMGMGPDAWTALRLALSRLLRAGGPIAQADPARRALLLAPMAECELLLPAVVGDYTDFYASIFHATNVGALMRPDSPLPPAYKYLPIGYHGRASSLVLSGTPVRRPVGQLPQGGGQPPTFGPSARLDYELELGFFVGSGNPLGEPVPIAEAGGRLFGLCLLNDWSARDIQRWEYQPLGPFLGKSFATSLSPWVVMMEALAPFRCPAFARGPGDPDPLPYLNNSDDQQRGGLDLTLEVLICSRQMRAAGLLPVPLSRSSAASLYWTPAQLVAHHTSNGCNLRPGDLLGSGTVSGPGPGERGCLLELTRGGQEPATLPTGETRRFLEDGDEVILRGHAERAGFRRISLGECRGVVLAAP